jgi:SAM-dependent methyltransferase
MARPRRRRYAAAVAGVCLWVVGSLWLARQFPLPAKIALSALGLLLSYLMSYFVARKAGRASPKQRVAVGMGAVLIAGLLTAAVGAGRQGITGWVPAVSGAAMTGSCVAGYLLGRRRRRRRKPPGRESALAHHYLDGMKGLEIGGSIHNPFGLDTLNVDYTASLDTIFKQAEVEIAGGTLPVDVVASGDALPFLDESQDFVVSSHVLEHLPDPIMALKEWYRVIRPGGFIFMIIPHKERTFDRSRPRTTLAELLHRHRTGQCPGAEQHCSVWITEDVVELVTHLGWSIVEVQDVDDKAGNGFTVVIQKGGALPPVRRHDPSRREVTAR